MKELLLGLTLLTSISSFANDSCIVKAITCEGCKDDISVSERVKDELSKRGYSYDEGNINGLNVSVKYNTLRPKAIHRVMHVCQYQQVAPEPGLIGTFKSLFGPNMVRGCEFSKKEEKERLMYAAGGANFHSISLDISPRGFQSHKKLKKGSDLSKAFAIMLENIDIKDCI